MRGITATPMPANERILSVKIKTELDIVAARQRARQVAALLGFPLQDQVDLATALSETARNAFQHAGGGAVDFEINLSAQSQFLWIQVSDHGPGIEDLDAVLAGGESPRTTLGVGLTGARRLVERFEISSGLGKGTCVRLGKALPMSLQPLDKQALARVASQLAQHPTPGVLDEVQQQNRELARTLESLRSREAEVETRKLEADRLNLELAETNRGVVALYGELEEKAVELRRASELKSQFLSHVSHEFRTPLNSVMALTHLLLRRTDGELTAEQEKQVTFIRQATSGLVEMVNDLLDLAKVESGKTEVHMVPVEVSQLLGPVRALMRPLATNDMVNLVFEDPPSSLMLDTDEAKVGQILRNLISNALKFTERGEVRLSVRLSQNSDSVSFVVSDTGIGIAPEDIEIIFQEFSQVQHSIQRRVKGTGLGLSLSRKLAGLLGGTLEVTSRVGVGSTFVLNLPVSAATSSYSQPPVGLESGDGAILIVDDEEASRYVCRQMFRGTSHRIIESGALEAAERARFERPQLIILDLMMPGRTGFEVLDELKSDAITKDIPVVIHTSKIITDADLHRLAGRQLALLPKSGFSRKQALLAIRATLREETLFVAEPEFASPAEPEPENT